MKEPILTAASAQVAVETPSFYARGRHINRSTLVVGTGERMLDGLMVILSPNCSGPSL